MTTRQCELVPNFTEVECGLLSEEEAMKLLLEQARLSKEPPLAQEVLKLCGRLALTVSIAGGMVRAYGGCVDEDLLELLGVRDRADASR